MKSFFTVILGFSITISVVSSDMVIYQKGKNLPSIKSTSAKADGAMKMISEYFMKTTGEKLSSNGTPEIKLAIIPNIKVDPESFNISFPDDKTILIQSPTEWGLSHAVNEFIERAFGVRWLYPGKEGEYIPRKTKIMLPMKTIQMSPAFLVRNFALDHSRKEDYAWARHNKGTFAEIRILPERIWFQHNIFNLVPQKLYSKTNPEFYPLLKGKRFIPDNKFNIYWQPCYSASGLPQVMAKHVELQALKEANVSFGVNDGANHCECEACLKTDGSIVNCFGFINRTRSYLQCMNKVAELSKKKGRKFGFIAYDAIAEPAKNLKLHPALVPVMTFSRMNWIDPMRRKRDQELTLRWRNITGSSIGWYDYFQQKYFLIPPVYFHLFAEYIRWAYKNGVKYYYAEINRSDDWHTGPMNYLVLKLLWNPNLDTDKILQEWYVCAVGKDAAPYLTEYFNICENYWTGDIAKTKWFYPERQFMANGSPDYLEKFDFSKLERMLALLEKANQLSKGKPYAQKLLEGFKKHLPNFRIFERNLKLERNAANVNFKLIVLEDFSGNKQTWTTWQRTISQGKFSTSEGTMKMDMTNSHKDMIYMKDFPVIPGKVYRVTADVKMVGLTPGGIVSVTAAWMNEQNKWIDSSYNAFKKQEEDFSFAWKTITVYVTAPNIENARMRVMLGANNSEKGFVYWDNIKIEKAQ